MISGIISVNETVEAQDIADAVLDAEVRIGELTKKMQTAPGQRTDLKPDRNSAERLTTKAERLAEIGIKPDTAERYEALANHREVVEAVKAEARESKCCRSGQSPDSMRRRIAPPTY